MLLIIKENGVIKIYVEHGEDNTVWSKAKFQEIGRAACKLEVDRLTTFYKFLKKRVAYEELNGFPCVVMPFFRILPDVIQRLEAP